MKNFMTSVKMTAPNVSKFDLSHDVKLSCNMGYLVPVLIMDCIPSDKFQITQESMCKLAPMVAPVMHRMDVTFHTFFVPNRILWDNWENYITNTKVNGVLPAHPFLLLGDVSTFTKLVDYMGLPVTGAGNDTTKINALPFAAYHRIWHEYYRDQNLQLTDKITLVDGDNSTYVGQLTELKKRAWEHDYFTSCLPFAQKGDAIDIPLGDISLKPFPVSAQKVVIPNTGAIAPAGPIGSQTISGDLEHVATGGEVVIDPNGTLQVNPVQINDLRKAFRLQEWLEKAARGGTRYFENILVYFGMRSPDSRLQRPEYITGSKSPIQISEVLNTTGTSDAPQGNMSGHGIAITSGANGYYTCQEHGFIISLMSVMPKTAYQQGIPKMYLKGEDNTEYLWPDFCHLGEQAVKRQELYGFDSTNGEETFGYIPRYSEYRYMPNRVAGDFRTTLDYWHMGRIFSASPTLNESFITCDATTRIFAVDLPDIDHLWLHVFNRIKATRPLPVYGTPTF